MAVSSSIPNITPSYSLVQQALEKSSDIQSRNTGTMGALAAVAAPVDKFVNKEYDSNRDYAHSAGLLGIKSHLEDQMKEREQNRTFDLGGGLTLTEQHAQDLADSMGVPVDTIKPLIGHKFTNEKDLTDTLMSSHKYGQNIHDELEKDSALKNLQDVMKDPKATEKQRRAAAIRVVSISEKMNPGSSKAISDLAVPEDLKANKPPIHYYTDTGTGLNMGTDGVTTWVVGSGSGSGSGPKQFTDQTPLNPVETKKLTKYQDAYTKEAEPLKKSLASLETTKKLLSDPTGKGLAQNVASIGVVRDAIGSASRINAIELQKITGLPDIKNRMARLSKMNLEGETLTSEDVAALNAILDLKAQEKIGEIKRIEDDNAQKAANAAPGVHPDLAREFIAGRDTSSKRKAPPKAKTIKQGGHTYTLNEQTGQYE